jgi:hypothetical protein
MPCHSRLQYFAAAFRSPALAGAAITMKNQTSLAGGGVQEQVTHVLARSCSSKIGQETPQKRRSFLDERYKASNPGRVATTTPHNERDYRTTTVGIIVSAIVRAQILGADAGRIDWEGGRQAIRIDSPSTHCKKDVSFTWHNSYILYFQSQKKPRRVPRLPNRLQSDF